MHAITQSTGTIDNIKHILNNLTNYSNTVTPPSFNISTLTPSIPKWNSVYESLEFYLQNWPILVSIPLDESITSKIMNINIKNNVFTALSSFRDKYKISNAMKIWKNLVSELEPIHPEREVEKAKKRKDMIKQLQIIIILHTCWIPISKRTSNHSRRGRM